MSRDVMEEMRKKFGKLNASAGKAAGYRLKRGGIKDVPIDMISDNPWQPRATSDEKAMEELVRSMETHGMLQPVVVYEKEGRYVLVAGHRRTEAARRLGWKNVKALVLPETPTEAELAEKAIAENMARKNLSPLEIAVAFHRYKETHGLSYEEAARRMGMSKPSFIRYVSILKLPAGVLEKIASMSSVDVTALSLLKGFDDETAEALFEGYIANGREWLRDEVKRLRGSETRSSPYTIKEGKRSYTVKVKKEAVDEEALQAFLSATPQKQKEILSILRNEKEGA